MRCMMAISLSISSRLKRAWLRKMLLTATGWSGLSLWCPNLVCAKAPSPKTSPRVYPGITISRALFQLLTQLNSTSVSVVTQSLLPEHVTLDAGVGCGQVGRKFQGRIQCHIIITTQVLSAQEETLVFLVHDFTVCNSVVLMTPATYPYNFPLSVDQITTLISNPFDEVRTIIRRSLSPRMLPCMG